MGKSPLRVPFPHQALFVGVALAAAVAFAATDNFDEFARSIRPVLAQHCGGCHDPANTKNPADFLKAQSAKDMESKRGLWRNVAAQMRNRSMPPIASKLTEEDRLRVATWVENRLRETACNVGEFAGAVAIRRLNRREYRNTVHDLLGVDLDVSEIFPADGSGGSGFDTNGETLYVGQLLSERYIEAAQQALDRAIITPPLVRNFTGAAMTPAKPERGLLSQACDTRSVFGEPSLKEFPISANIPANLSV